MKFLERFNLLANRILLVVASLSLVCMMLLVVVNIILRQVYVPLGGTPELVGWMTAVTISFALGYAQTSKAHVTFDLLVSHFSGRSQDALQVLVDLLSLLFFGIVAWQLFKYGQTVMARGSLSPTMQVIFHPYIYMVGLGFCGFELSLLSDLVQSFLRVVKSGSARQKRSVQR